MVPGVDGARRRGTAATGTLIHDRLPGSPSSGAISGLERSFLAKPCSIAILRTRRLDALRFVLLGIWRSHAIRSLVHSFIRHKNAREPFRSPFNVVMVRESSRQYVHVQSVVPYCT